ncbi:hypothetical protein DBR47_16120 [Paucibacter sp. KBW04]|uniref:exopolysaccharide biosynthesis protein n=1 Tax=Paucibacter sp. KBW04 TaxID=2153361 RepID=UPI000F58A3D9|nr:exopolysaccharide biosynthesis protein [Paucibacter sp. KBW04]RQO57345.1 hypothetical protein DBR47_16120 [Paucibacter sp. KBW04]
MSKLLAEVFHRAAQAHSEAHSETGAAPDSFQELSLPDLLRLHGEASAAVLLLLMAVLSVMPMAGVGTLLSLVIFVIAWRWSSQLDGSIVPERLGRVRLNALWSRRCLRFLAWMYGLSDRLMKARWTWTSHSRTHTGWRVWIALMGVLILLPLPLGNVLPSLSLVLLSLGWMFRDGLALLASALVGSGAVAFALMMGHVLLDAGQRALAWISAWTGLDLATLL